MVAEAVELVAEACEIPAEWRHANGSPIPVQQTRRQGSTCAALTSFAKSFASMDAIMRGALPCCSRRSTAAVNRDRIVNPATARRWALPFTLSVSSVSNKTGSCS